MIVLKNGTETQWNKIFLKNTWDPSKVILQSTAQVVVVVYLPTILEWLKRCSHNLLLCDVSSGTAVSTFHANPFICWNSRFEGQGINVLIEWSFHPTCKLYTADMNVVVQLYWMFCCLSKLPDNIQWRDQKVIVFCALIYNLSE